MYDDLDQADNNQWKFCFSRSVFRYQKQWYESLFEQTLADFDKIGGVGKVQKEDMDVKVGELLENVVGGNTCNQLSSELKG